MEITSIGYLVFVGISLLVYWHVPRKIQWWILLADSLLFYFLNASAGTFIYVLVSAASAYLAGRYFGQETEKKKKKRVLLLAILLNAGILVVLKYSNLFIDSFNRLFHGNAGALNLLSSLAVSYYTLQIIAYLTDTYLGTVRPEQNPLKLLLFTMFFPQMVSGPISRWSGLGKQLFEEHRFDYNRVITGMRRVLFGVAKKVVVADRLAVVVNYLFSHTDTYTGVWVIVAALLFVTELYFDFSGCMDVILGVSKCFGILLPENFNAPFLSRSVQEFWQKWHITLGGWLRDYIMYPISRSALFRKFGKTCKKAFGKSGIQIPYYPAMFVVWTLMGIWHGSSWKYMVGEGWYFWVIIVSSQMLAPVYKKLNALLRIPTDGLPWRIFQVIRTAVLFAVGNIAFRAESLGQTFAMWRNIFRPAAVGSLLTALKDAVYADIGGMPVYLCIAFIGLLQIVCDVLVYKQKDGYELLSKAKLPVRWFLYFAVAGIIVFSGAFGKSQFIYFGF